MRTYANVCVKKLFRNFCNFAMNRMKNFRSLIDDFFNTFSHCIASLTCKNVFFRVGDFENYFYKIYAKLVPQGFNID